MFPYVSVVVLIVALLLTGFFTSASRLSLIILQGLHAYLLPEDSDKSALDTSKGHGAEKEGETTEKLKKNGGKKKKERDIFDESGAQILRIRLSESQLETRKYFDEYEEAVVYCSLGLTNFVTREILLFISTSSLAKKHGWVEVLTPDERISFMVSFFAAYKILRLLAKVSYDPQLARKSERLLKWSVGILGFFVASSLLIFVPNSIIDFGIDDAVADAGKAVVQYMQKKGVDFPENFAIPPTSVKVLVGALSGLVSGILFGPAIRNAKCFWVGTDQLQWNISVLKRSPLARPFLNLGIVLPLLVTLLWVKPMAEIFVHSPNAIHSPQFDSGEILDLGNLDQRTVSEYLHRSGKLGDRGGEISQSAAGAGSQMCSSGQSVLQSVHEAECEVIERDESSQRDPREQDSQKVKSLNGELGLFQSARIQNFLEEEEKPGVLNMVFMSRKYDWAAGFGVSESTFGLIRLWCLFLTGLLQIFLLRVNLQTYCHGAVLLWYESLHQSKAHNPEITKAKIFLNNYFVCRISIQCLVPGVLVLLMIGLARTKGNDLGNLVQEGYFVFAPSLIRGVMFFSLWWLVFSSAIQTWVTLALFRFGILTSTA